MVECKSKAQVFASNFTSVINFTHTLLIYSLWRLFKRDKSCDCFTSAKQQNLGGFVKGP